MKYQLLVFIFLTFFIQEVASQCDCNIFPVRLECKKKCGMQLLQAGSKAQLKKALGLGEETAQKVVKDPHRRNKKSVDDFQKSMPRKNFLALKGAYQKWLINFSQNTANGDNVAGNKNVTYNTYLSRDSTTTNYSAREKFIMPKLKGTYYCMTAGFYDKEENIEINVILESIGEKGRIEYISDTTGSVKYNFSMYVNPNLHGGWGMGTKSSIFGPGDVLKFYIWIKVASSPFDIHFLNSDGTEYFQRATLTKGASCKFHVLSAPIKVKP